MKRCYFLTGFLFLLLSARAQEVQWEWAQGTTHAQTRILSIDRIGNIHGVAPYEKTLPIGDTLFSHNSYYFSYPYYNQALFNYDRSGKFLMAGDIQGLESKNLSVTSSIEDEGLNQYVTGSFTFRMFVDDSMINHGTVPYIDQPEVYLLKLKLDHHYDWVKLVSGFYTDYSLGMADAGGGEFILGTAHSWEIPNCVVFLGQDTLTFRDPMRVAVERIDANGTIKWVRSFGYLDYDYTASVNRGENGMYYIIGNTGRGIVIEGDTILNPYYNDLQTNRFYPYQVRITADGAFRGVSYFPWFLGDPCSIVASDGSRYFAGMINDSLIVGQDTIRRDQDTLVSIILRVDSLNQIIWYRLLKFGYTVINWPKFYLTPWHDSVWFTTQCPGTFSFAGHSYQGPDSAFLYTGLLGPDGILYRENITGPAWQVKPNSILTDRCGNVVIGGVIESDMVFGSDTIHTPLYNDMGFIAKLRIHPPGSIELGPDTAACARYTIQGPPGYAEYCWNNGAGWSQDLTITKSGMYHLQVSDDGNCWSEDSVFVLIREKPASGMTDTTVAFHDSIILKVPSHYDSYLWSTGSTADSIMVKGADLPPTGKVLYWIDLVKGVCETRDTFFISRKNNIGIEDTRKAPFSLYPNPAGNSIEVGAADHSGSPADIRIYEIRGILVHQEVTSANPCRIDLSGDSPGIYIVRIIRDNVAWTGRFVKN
jgi:hypothetical protein